MDGCVPDSIRYVPGRSELQVSAAVLLTATSVPKDCTRGPWAGGVKAWPRGTAVTVGHVASVCVACVGLGTHVEPVAPPRVLEQLVVTDPSPPPTWPTIIRDVGTLLLFANDRLLVRLMVKPLPVGTVITTGDHPVPAAGFEAAQVARAVTPVQV